MITKFIKCKQVVEYYQQVELTDKEYALLESVTGDDVSETDKPNYAYRLLEDKINHSEVFDTGHEYLTVQLLSK